MRHAGAAVGVLVLPGGKVASRERARGWQLAQVRAAGLAVGLRRRLGAGYRVEQVRYRFRGWNTPELDAVNDAEEVLRAMRAGCERVVLVGHSMGGRVAVRLAAEHDVSAVVALAPWWPAGDAGVMPVSCRLRVVHGTADRWTDPESSRRQVDSARRRGVDAEWRGIEGAGHFMMYRPGLWHDLAAGFVESAG
ncbi:alpha/beta fold hydrolase [Nocardia yunnanensis]|uniref:Alpha/beta fold hydrolase n=1 Tax=Nocardia yunnanensis TaxID=2382165 RepID=A0A386ZNL4_9NOCA|nr:alpha/beta fold hydrolase [Nocardia yunnanensis]